MTNLTNVCRNGDLETEKNELNAGTNPAALRRDAIQVAARNGHFAVV